MTNPTALTVKIQPDTSRQLREHCKTEHKKISAVATQAVQEYLDRQNGNNVTEFRQPHPERDQRLTEQEQRPPEKPQYSGLGQETWEAGKAPKKLYYGPEEEPENDNSIIGGIPIDHPDHPNNKR